MQAIDIPFNINQSTTDQLLKYFPSMTFRSTKDRDYSHPICFISRLVAAKRTKKYLFEKNFEKQIIMEVMAKKDNPYSVSTLEVVDNVLKPTSVYMIDALYNLTPQMLANAFVVSSYRKLVSIHVSFNLEEDCLHGELEYVKCLVGNAVNVNCSLLQKNNAVETFNHSALEWLLPNCAYRVTLNDSFGWLHHNVQPYTIGVYSISHFTLEKSPLPGFKQAIFDDRLPGQIQFLTPHLDGDLNVVDAIFPIISFVGNKIYAHDEEKLFVRVSKSKLDALCSRIAGMKEINASTLQMAISKAKDLKIDGSQVHLLSVLALKQHVATTTKAMSIINNKEFQNKVKQANALLTGTLVEEPISTVTFMGYSFGRQAKLLTTDEIKTQNVTLEFVGYTNYWSLFYWFSLISFFFLFLILSFAKISIFGRNPQILDIWSFLSEFLCKYYYSCDFITLASKYNAPWMKRFDHALTDSSNICSVCSKVQGTVSSWEFYGPGYYPTLFERFNGLPRGYWFKYIGWDYEILHLLTYINSTLLLAIVILLIVFRVLYRLTFVIDFPYVTNTTKFNFSAILTKARGCFSRDMFSVQNYRFVVSKTVLTIAKTYSIGDETKILDPLSDQWAAYEASNISVSYPKPTMYRGIVYSLPLPDDLPLDPTAHFEENENAVDKVDYAPAFCHVGFNITPLPQITQKSSYGEKVAILLRVLKDPPVGDFEFITLHYSIIFKNINKFLNLKENIKIYPLDTLQWTTNFPLLKGEMFFNSSYHKKSVNVCKAFQKIEPVNKDLYLKPSRIVLAGDDYYNSIVGPYVSAVYIMFKLCWNVSFMFYISGGTESAEVEGHMNYFLKSRGYDTSSFDFSSFDTTVSRAALEFAYACYNHISPERKPLKLMHDKIEKQGISSFGHKFTVDGKMASGQPDTLLTDSLISAAHHLIAFSHVTGKPLQKIFDEIEPRYTQHDIDHYFSSVGVIRNEVIAVQNTRLEYVNLREDQIKLKSIKISDYDPDCIKHMIHYDNKSHGCGDDIQLYLKTPLSVTQKQLYVDTMVRLGMNITVNNNEEICSSIPYPVRVKIKDGESTMLTEIYGPKIGRISTKLGIIIKPLGKDIINMLYQKTLGLRRDVSFIPILSDLVNKQLELLPVYKSDPNYHKYKSHAEEDHSPSAETYQFLIDRYPSLTMEGIIELQTLIKSVTQLPVVITHPLLFEIYMIDNDL
jgi:hypothetical protein